MENYHISPSGDFGNRGHKKTPKLIAVSSGVTNKSVILKLSLTSRVSQRTTEVQGHL